MLTGLLFGQDTTLALNNGRTITGKIISETDSTYIIESEHVLNKIFKRGIIGLMLNLNKNPLTTEKEIQKVILAQPKEVGLHRKPNWFGQDGLILKSGEVYNGTFIRNVDELIVFQVEGENHFTPFPINDVAIIKTSDGEFTYPFIPNYNLKNQQQKFVNKAGTIFLGALGCFFIFQILMIKYLENLIGAPVT